MVKEYKLAVFVEDITDIESLRRTLSKMLDPFEYKSTYPKEYVEWISVKDEYMKIYENEYLPKILIPTEEQDNYLILNPNDPLISTKYKNKSLIRMSLKANQLYSTFNEFMKDYAQHIEYNTEKDDYGYWDNLNVKFYSWELRDESILKYICPFINLAIERIVDLKDESTDFNSLASYFDAVLIQGVWYSKKVIKSMILKDGTKELEEEYTDIWRKIFNDEKYQYMYVIPIICCL